MNRRLLTTTLVLATCAAVLIGVAPAQASPVAAKKARLREVQAKLDSVGVQVSKAVEDYNQAQSRLETTQARIEENQRLLKAATRKLDRADRQLTARARDLYKTPTTGIVDAVFSARSFDDLVAQFDLMRRVGNSDVDTVKAVEAYQRDIKDRRIALRADARVATKLVEKRAAEISFVGMFLVTAHIAMIFGMHTPHLLMPGSGTEMAVESGAAPMDALTVIGVVLVVGIGGAIALSARRRTPRTDTPQI